MQDKKALGRGLSSLISQPEAQQAELDSDRLRQEAALEKWIYKGKAVVYLPVEKIVPNRFQPRVKFPDDKLKELMDSVSQTGVIQPILVRQTGEDVFEVLAGERRLRAVKELKMDRIPAIIEKAKDLDALQIALVENIQRDDLNPLEEAKAFKQLMSRFGLDYQAVATLVGKAQTSVVNSIRLLTLTKKVQEALLEGLITMGHAKAILALKDPAEQLKLCREIIDKKLSVREAERLSGEKKSQITGRPPKAQKDPHAASIEERLQRALGTKVRLYPSKRGGRLVIEYFSDDDLLRIIDILTSRKEENG